MKNVKKSIPKIFIVALLFVTSMFTVSAQDKVKTVFEFEKLPYTYNSLEPYIDSTTMRIHYSKHHRAYYDNFLKSIAGTEYEYQNLNVIFANISKAPAAVRNMGGGYYNHAIFWANLSPTPVTLSTTCLSEGETSGKLVEKYQKKLKCKTFIGKRYFSFSIL